jgi:hypothetical protein
MVECSVAKQGRNSHTPVIFDLQNAVAESHISMCKHSPEFKMLVVPRQDKPQIIRRASKSSLLFTTARQLPYNALSQRALTEQVLVRVIVDDGSTDGTSEAIREEFFEVDIIQDVDFGTPLNQQGTSSVVKEPDYILPLTTRSSMTSFYSALFDVPSDTHGPGRPLLLLWISHKVFR